MLTKLKVKFIVILMVVVSVMLCIVFGMMYQFTKANLKRDSIDMLESIAENPFRMGRPGEFGEAVQLPHFTLQLGTEQEVVATGGGYYDLSDEEFLEEIVEAVFLSGEQTGLLEEYNLRFYQMVTPANHFLIFIDTSNEQAILKNLLQTSAFIGSATLVSFFGISLLLAKWTVKPVDRAWQQQRQFVSDASHELKTPLTVIMTNAELLQNSDNDETNCATFSDNILSMAHQMRRLLEQMLELARADNMQAKTVFSEVNLSKLAADTALMFEFVFFEKGMSLETSIASDVRIEGSEAQLKQVLEILLDNAQKYARPDGRTRVILVRQPWNRCLLTVANEGEPVPPEHLHNLFRRFYRADEARNGGGSFGLGLSIAENIVTAHKGKIWAQSSMGINSFHIDFPCNAHRF